MAELTAQHAIMAVAVENFSTRTIAQQQSSREELLEVVESAVHDVPALHWDDFCVEERSDHILMLIVPAFSPVSLAGPFLTTLNRRLAESDTGLTTAPPMRLRVALHLGLAGLDEQGWSGEGVELACGLVDAKPLRLVLRAATKAYIAFIVSDDTHQSVIRREYRLVDAAAYALVRFDGRQFARVKGWITVPGYPAPPGVEPDGPDGKTAGDEPGAPSPSAGRAPLFVQNAGVVRGAQIGVQINNPGSVQL